MTDWGRKMFVTPGVVVDGKLVTTDLVRINLGIRIMLGSSYYEDWGDQEMFVTRDPLGNPVDRRHPWNQHTNPRPQKRDLEDKYSWVMSPRWYDGEGQPGAGYRRRSARPPLVHRPCRLRRHRLPQSHRAQRPDRSPQDCAEGPGQTLEWKIPQWSNTLERNRARTYFQAYAAAARPALRRTGVREIRAGRTKTWESFEVPEEAISCGFTEAVRGVLSHHMAIRDGKIANYHPYPPTPWNASPRDYDGTPGPYEDAVQGQPIFEENDREHFKGIDIMRTVRSFDPCLPCGVHMYLGEGRRWTCCTPPCSRSPVSSPPWTGRICWARPVNGSSSLLDALGSGGPVARDRAEELVRQVTELYGPGWSGSCTCSIRRVRSAPDGFRPHPSRPLWFQACS